MPASCLSDLAAQLCAVCGGEPPELRAGFDGGVAFSVTTRDVRIEITHDPVDRARDFLVHICFGEIPPGAAATVLRELLHANAAVRGPAAPVFSLREDTSEVILTYVYPLAEASGDHLWAAIQAVVEIVLEWRTNFFLAEAARPLADTRLFA